MGYSRQDLDSFHQFAVERLSNGGASATLEECLKSWRESHETAEVIADIQASIDDEKAGRLRPLRDVDAEIRHELGFSR